MRVLLVMPTPFENGRLGLENVIWLSEPVALTPVGAAMADHEVRVLDMRLEARVGPGRGSWRNSARRRRDDEHDDRCLSGEGRASHGAPGPAGGADDRRRPPPDAVPRTSSTSLTSTSSCRARASHVPGAGGRLGPAQTSPAIARSTACAAPLPRDARALGSPTEKREQTARLDDLPVARPPSHRQVPGPILLHRRPADGVDLHEPRLLLRLQLLRDLGVLRAPDALSVRERIVDQLEACEEPFVFVLDDNFLTSKSARRALRRARAPQREEVLDDPGPHRLRRRPSGADGSPRARTAS